MDRRTVVALLLAGAIFAVGCGGDDEGESPEEAPTPATRSSTPPAGEEKDKQAEEKKAEDGGDEKSTKKKSRLERQLERLPRSKRIAAIKRGAVIAAGLNGLLHVSVTVSRDGRSVSIAVPPNVACTAKSGADTRTADRIKKDIPYVKSVTVTVSGRSFAAHRPSCRTRNVPGGSGSVVYSKNGIGNFDSPAFKITAKKWTVAYRNDDGFFSVFVLKNGKPLNDVITTFKGSSGKKTFSGPGAFKLRISGGSPWAVTVRNGA